MPDARTAAAVRYPEKARAARQREAERADARAAAAREREREDVRRAVLHSLGRDLDPFPPRTWDDDGERWVLA